MRRLTDMQRVARGDDIGPAAHPAVLLLAVVLAGALGYGVATLIAWCT
jgi:hypothetical protein